MKLSKFHCTRIRYTDLTKKNNNLSNKKNPTSINQNFNTPLHKSHSTSTRIPDPTSRIHLKHISIFRKDTCTRQCKVNSVKRLKTTTVSLADAWFEKTDRSLAIDSEDRRLRNAASKGLKIENDRLCTRVLVGSPLYPRTWFDTMEMMSSSPMGGSPN